MQSQILSHHQTFTNFEITHSDISLITSSYLFPFIKVSLVGPSYFHFLLYHHSLWFVTSLSFHCPQSLSPWGFPVLHQQELWLRESVWLHCASRYCWKTAYCGDELPVISWALGSILSSYLSASLSSIFNNLLLASFHQRWNLLKWIQASSESNQWVSVLWGTAPSHPTNFLNKSSVLTVLDLLQYSFFLYKQAAFINLFYFPA